MLSNFDRSLSAVFFDAVRPLFGGLLKQSQVDGLKAIVAAWNKYGDGDTGKLAYVLATAFLETAQTMQPVRETLASSDAKAKEILTKAWKSGKLKVSKDYWSSGYFGRGYVQLTHKENYEKAGRKLGVDLVGNPSLALDPDISARVLIVGMLEGWFTGKRLDSYIGDGVDFINARRVVNGTDKAPHIAMLANSFLRALEAVPATPPAPSPPPEAAPQASGLPGALLALISFILGLFKRKSP